MFSTRTLKTKITIVVVGMLFVFATALSLEFYYGANQTLHSLATVTLTMKLKGDINSSRHYIDLYYGSLSFANGQLLDFKGQAINNRFEVVDEIKDDLGIVATVFAKDGDDFTRVVTNVFNDQNKRAVGTKLGAKSAAFEPIKRKEQYIGNAKILGKIYLTAYDPIVDKQGALIGILFVGIPLTEIDGLISVGLTKSIFMSIGITVFFLLIFGIVLIVLIRKHLTPLNHLTEILKIMSVGDLTKRINVISQDEIGQVSISFNNFIEKLQVTIRHITSSSGTVASSASELSATSAQIASNADEMTAQTATVASAIKQATQNISTISSVTEEMSSNANIVAIAIEEMSASLNEVAKSCQEELKIVADASTNARNGKEIMDRLGVAAKSIGKVVEVINDIADQTNLLALNATIEAASAGEAGKGFSVVAQEVKELAKQTAQATEEIEKEIEGMQSNTTSAMKVIELVATVIEEVNMISQTIVSAVEEQSATINEIAKNVNQVNVGSQEVVRNVSQSEKSFSEITNSINGVSSAASDTSQGIFHVKSSAEELSKLSIHLKELLQQFKI